MAAARGSPPWRIDGSNDSSTRRDVVTRVRRQHDTIRRLFDDVEQAAPARRAEAFQPLVRLLAVHETAEEMVVHPALLLAGSEAQAVLRARKAEEDQAKEDLAELEGLHAGSREFLTQLRALRGEVEAHAEAEEAEVLPLLDEHRARDDLASAELRISSTATASQLTGPMETAAWGTCSEPEVLGAGISVG
jgi:hypothetical protein